MPTFEYKVRTKEGKMQFGTVEATSEEAVLDLLHEKGVTVINLKEQTKSKLDILSYTWAHRITQKDVVILSRQLSILFEAQIPIVEALRTLGDETAKPALREIVSTVLDDVTGGLSLSRALAKHPNVFSIFYVNLVRSGEESGKLQEVFIYLADYLERSYYLTVKARNSMIYPGFILLAFVGVIVLLLVSVIPQLVAIFEETGQPIPIYTQAIIWSSEFLQQWGIGLLVLVMGAGAFLTRWARTRDGWIFFSRMQIKIPFVGDLYRKLYMARLADNLQILLSSGIPILRALEITKEVVGNAVYAGAMDVAIEAVRGGSTISSAFKRVPDVPGMVTNMMRIGETTGRLDFVLEKVSKFYQQEVNSAVDNLVSLIEPLLILILGGGVGLLVASVLVPLYNLVGAF